jgi:hypothetical protein
MTINKKQRVLTIVTSAVAISVLTISNVYAVDLNAGMKGAFEPVIKLINDWYPAGIFASGMVGAFFNAQGDLRDKFSGFGKGALLSVLVIAGAKAGLGI